MLNFLKKLFGLSEQHINVSNVFEKQSVECLEEQSSYVIMPKIKNENLEESSLDELLWQLRSYDGYIRQSTLEQLQDCYETALFPALLFRLSDYVPINQKLAAIHLQRWSERPEFSRLCVDYFLDIAAIQKRIRVVTEVEELLLKEVANNKSYLQDTLISLQGELPRILLVYIKKYQWVEHDYLIELCKVAKDQIVRKFWLDFIIQTQSNHELMIELQTSKFRDVQYRLFDVLYHRGVLTTDDLIKLWHSHYLSIMDYAYFALRQCQFDFKEYFTQYSIDSLNRQQLKIRAFQWILWKGDLPHFFHIIEKMESQKVANALVLFALKQKNIKLNQYLEYFHSTQQIVSPSQFIKAKGYCDTQPTLDELKQYLCLVEGSLSFQQKLDLTQGYSLWDQLYWFVTQQKFIETEKDQESFYYHLRCRLQFLSYETYPPRWTVLQKNEVKQHLPTFMKQYPEIFEDIGVRKILENI